MIKSKRCDTCGESTKLAEPDTKTLIGIPIPPVLESEKLPPVLDPEWADLLGTHPEIDPDTEFEEETTKVDRWSAVTRFMEPAPERLEITALVDSLGAATRLVTSQRESDRARAHDLLCELQSRFLEVARRVR